MKTANSIQKKTMLLLLFLSLAILLSACVVFVSVTKEEAQMMNDYILALQNEDYAAAVALSHPWALAEEDGLKEFIQGLKDDNIMFQGEMDPGLPVDVSYYSDVSDGVQFTEKIYDCDYVIGDHEYVIRFTILHADDRIGVEYIGIRSVKDLK